MSNSTLRKATPRRTHLERSQLKSRRHLGFLEKHKDYAIRAKHYHLKQDRLRKLRQKAATRNPDEFYFGMISSKTKEGIHQVERKTEVAPETIQLLKSQDQNYITNQLRINAKKLESLKPIPKPQGSHIYFDKAPKKTPNSNLCVLKPHVSKEYVSRLNRDKVLREAEKELQLQKALMGKGKRQKLKNKKGEIVYKWKPERKR